MPCPQNLLRVDLLRDHAFEAPDSSRMCRESRESLVETVAAAAFEWAAALLEIFAFVVVAGIICLITNCYVLTKRGRDLDIHRTGTPVPSD